MQSERIRIGVVIPCYKVKKHVLSVIEALDESIDRIYAVDDKCPEGSGKYIMENCNDSRLRVLFNDVNLGVGGAVMRGYREGIQDGIDILVKIDGDGQMDSALIPSFVHPISSGQADYTKGNRFWDLQEINRMPFSRRLGNLGLSFLSKLSTGYWDVFDPTNGFTAIHSRVAENLPFNSMSQRYFFETDMLFRLNTLRAVVVDIPMHSRYADEVSNLKIGAVLPEFAYKNVRNFFKRIAYNYYLRDLSLASLELVIGAVLLLFGIAWGGYHWLQSWQQDGLTPVGTIMISTVAVISGLQFLLAFIGYDIANVPRRSLHRLLRKRAPGGSLNTANSGATRS